MEFYDLLYRTYSDPDPINANGLHDQTLVCITDIEDCCDAPHTVRGDWYYPDGNVIQNDTDGRSSAFRRNRGANEVINGRHFFGSVRLFCRWSPRQRGRFRCELPSAADPSVNQILYANIGEVIFKFSTIHNNVAFHLKFLQ